jgi:hypothetical protein
MPLQTRHAGLRDTHVSKASLGAGIVTGIVTPKHGSMFGTHGDTQVALLTMLPVMPNEATESYLTGLSGRSQKAPASFLQGQ